MLQHAYYAYNLCWGTPASYAVKKKRMQLIQTCYLDFVEDVNLRTIRADQ